jgi:hypothetical protein
MAVTTASYTQNPPYTAANFADKFRDALIDSGLMAAWHDSFNNGALEHRVLEVTYDASKTYGKTYYWFIFSGADMFMHVTTGWNIGSHIPAGQGGVGTIYLDWLSTATNTTANHLRLAALNAAQTITIKRYTYQTFTVFLFVNGTTNYTLFIDRTAPLSSFVDLNKEIYMGAMWLRTRIPSGSNVALAAFQSFPLRLKRTHLGHMMRNETGNYGANNNASPPYDVVTGSSVIFLNHTYGAAGNESSTPYENYATANVPCWFLPNRFNNVNPDYATDVKPAYEGLVLSPYSALTLPVSASGGEFVIYPIYNNNTLQVGATVVVTSGVEEYEIIACTNSQAINTRPSIAICARIV